jgi:hypothetical protein
MPGRWVSSSVSDYGEQPGGGIGQLVIGARVFETNMPALSLVGVMKVAQFATNAAWQEPGAPPQSASVEHGSFIEAEQVRPAYGVRRITDTLP